MKPKLQYASKGDAVVELQTRLNQAMPDVSPPLVPDGVYGSRTVQRVKQFQARRGLVADGIVGPATWGALDGTPPQKPPITPASSPNALLHGKRVSNFTRTFCSCGSGSAMLRFYDPSRSVATVRDNLPMVNVGPFGKCGSLQHPMVAWKSDAKGEFTPVACQPVLPHPWMPGPPIEAVGTPPAAALGPGSTLQCVWGGIISIKH